MSIGQAVLPSRVLDVAAVDRLETRLAAHERVRSLAHAEQLVDAVSLHRLYDAAGMGLGSAAQLALTLGCSESRANALLEDAFSLERLGALDPDVHGLLTVEQSRVVAAVLGPVEDARLACSL